MDLSAREKNGISDVLRIFAGRAQGVRVDSGSLLMLFYSVI